MELLLIPTAFERDLCSELLVQRLGRNRTRVELCGLGAIQAAIHATRLIDHLKPQRVWLVGLAGMYSIAKGSLIESPHELAIGRAYEFTRVAIHGIGVGEGQNHVSMASLGWNQRFGQERSAQSIINLTDKPDGPMLLTVCSASARSEEAADRQRMNPGSVAEDMESYCVALSCQTMGVPLRVIRGISNVAGDRNHTHWKSATAMTAAIDLLFELNSQQSTSIP